MVIKTDLCTFSEWRIYPGHGRRFVAKDGRLFYYLNQKSRAFSARKVIIIILSLRSNHKKSNGLLHGEDWIKRLKQMKEQRKEELEILKYKELSLVFHLKKLDVEERKMIVLELNIFYRNQKGISWISC